ncbi:MAG: hypothetical protein CMB77_03910 [Euryarchaeota archaeon]|nr:hypothetical protein [Euryarchaeota archaeon]|tara:strand:+ start:33536 stop:33730 length:195 start_codon:yes stop_codon:yes gene_type:complete
MKTVLSNESQAFLRKINMINEQEIAYRFGDLFIAENSITGARRQLQSVPDYVVENSKKPGLLKG